MMNKLGVLYLKATGWWKAQWRHLKEDQNGFAEIIVIILIILVAIALVAIFSDEIKDLVAGWLEQLKKGGNALSEKNVVE